MNEYTIHPHEAMVAKIIRWQDMFAFVVFDGEGEEFASGAAGDPIAVSDMMQDYLAAEWGNPRLACQWRVTNTGVNWTSCTLGLGHDGPHLFNGPESGTRGCSEITVVFDEPGNAAVEQADHDLAGYLLGKREALQAARDAVADCRVPWPTATGVLVNEGIDDALAAIDALRGEA